MINRIIIDVDEELKEIESRLKLLLTTPKGTMPMDRNYGIDFEAIIDKPVDVALEADFTCDGEWREVLRVQVPPGQKLERALPNALQAYWFRTVALGDATLSATFVYE